MYKKNLLPKSLYQKIICITRSKRYREENPIRHFTLDWLQAKEDEWYSRKVFHS
jgi:hypothetical protein